MTVNISLGNIQNIKEVYIEELGKTIRIRRLGAGEELDLSAKMRRLGKIVEELSNIDFTVLDAAKEEDRKEIEKLSKRAEKLSYEITEIKQFELDTFSKCLTDSEGGKVVKELLNMLSDEDRSEFFRQAFDTTTIIEAPEAVEAPESEEKSEDDE